MTRMHMSAITVLALAAGAVASAQEAGKGAVQDAKAAEVVKKLEQEWMDAYVKRDAAVITGKSIFKGKVKDQDVSGEYRFADVLVKRVIAGRRSPARSHASLSRKHAAQRSGRILFGHLVTFRLFEHPSRKRTGQDWHRLHRHQPRPRAFRRWPQGRTPPPSPRDRLILQTGGAPRWSGRLD